MGLRPRATHRGSRAEATEARLLRALVTLNVSLINIFFKIKAAKVNKTYTRELERGGSGPDRTHWVANHLDIEGQDGALGSNLPHIDAYLRTLYKIAPYYYWYLLAKNLIICLLRHETFARWRYLDCLLLGRYTINGRVIELTSYCACYVAIMRLIWIHAVTRPAPEFRMPCVEFLLDRAGHEPFWARASHPTSEFAFNSSPSFHSSLLEYENPFHELEQVAATTRPRSARDLGLARRPLPKLRPNRTRAAWQALARTSLLYGAISAAILTLLGILFLRMGLAVVVTRRGFEYTYRHCIQWVLKERQASGSSSAVGASLAQHLYEAFLDGARLPVGAASLVANSSYVRPEIIQEFMMPYEGLVSFGWFHSVRAGLDVFETAFLYLDIGLLLYATCFMSVILSKDILIYCRAIQRRLESHIVKRELACALTRPPRGSANMTLGREVSRASLADTADIQAQVADLLIMIDSYNRYMSPQSQCHLLYWFGYSGLVSSWIFVPGNESPKSEWYVIHVCATLYVFLLLSAMSPVKTSCRHLYRLVSAAMSLDEGHKTSKSVWLTLLKFFTPAPG